MENKTSLSAGIVVRELLKGITDKVYPIVASNSILPYISYRRRSMETMQTKSHPSDMVQIEVSVFTETYEESITLAEKVRERLEYNQKTVDGMRMRSCILVDAEEGWESDAYYQTLIFEIKI
ncbi:MAG: hypothetical protein LKE41_01010 [Prevotella sp.]|jgi:hypothetical protein|nr:hypothetical protein [Prevotella sp.]